MNMRSKQPFSDSRKKYAELRNLVYRYTEEEFPNVKLSEITLNDVKVADSWSSEKVKDGTAKSFFEILC